MQRFSNDCSKTKVISPNNQNRSKERDEPIRISCNYLQLAQSAGKIVRTMSDWFWFCFSLEGARFFSQSRRVVFAIPSFLSTFVTRRLLYHNYSHQCRTFGLISMVINNLNAACGFNECNFFSKVTSHCGAR